MNSNDSSDFSERLAVLPASFGSREDVMLGSVPIGLSLRRTVVWVDAIVTNKVRSQ